MTEVLSGGPAADQDGRPPRWRPVRAGILNVWRYYDEVFAFHRGRLLLRGPNGTGKSKALEVLLPFLFDASLRPNRLSTFGTADRTMHWNLMGEGATGVTRVGYVWLEFGAGGRWFTCGARLQATARTTSVGVDYFTSSRRIGMPGGLRLVNDQAQPLTRAALAQALGADGTLYASAPEYRQAVRTTLFPGMGEQRFDALITALLQLRTPKLSQRLDPGLLSTLLSRALPPLDQADIAELAEGFERLDRQREELRHLDEVVAAAGQLATRVRTYARRVLRAGAATLISATSTMDRLTRDARLSEAQYLQVSQELAAADTKHEQLREQRLAVDSRISGLVASDAYREGEHLVQLRRRSGDARAQAGRLQAAAATLAHQAAQARERADRQQQEADQADARAEQARARLARGAERLELPALVPEPGPDVDVQVARAVVRAGVTDRTDRIAQVREALRRHQDAVADRGRAEAEADRATDVVSVELAAGQKADAAYAAALQALADELAGWVADCVELRPDLDALLGSVGSAAAVAGVVTAARDVAAGALADARSAWLARRAPAVERRDTVAAELARCLQAVDLPPLAPATRTADRDGRPGAPLWRVTTFAPGLPVPLQAGIEAALEASGLLDAWIGPDGGVVDGEGHDVFVLSDPDGAPAGRALPAGETLASALIPEDDAPVPRPVVAALLARIALDTTLPPTGDVAVGADGSWRLAALTGTYGKPEACHIGAAARARARARRVDDLRAELAVLEASVAEIEAELGRLDERRRRLDEEVARRPGHAAVDDAGREQDRAAARVEAAQEYRAAATHRVAEAERLAADALRSLTAVAAGHRLPADAVALDRMTGALADLSAAADSWAHGEVTARQARELAQVRQDGVRDAVAACDAATTEAVHARETAVDLQARLEAVESAVGSSYEDVVRRIEQARGELEAVLAELDGLELTRRKLLTRQGELDATRRRDARERDDAVTARDAAGAHVRALLGGFLPQDAGIAFETDAPGGVRPTLEAARAVAARWASLPYEPRHVAEAHSRLLETVHDTRDALTTHADVELVTDGEVQVLSAAVGGLRVGATGLLQAMTAARDSSRDDITASEHDLFDTTLTGDTRRHLAARIRQAGDLVDAMNTRLDLVRTASDVAVRLTWQVDPALPPGTRAARDLLLKDPVHLSEADRSALHDFFRQRIEGARAANTAMTWEQQLTEVFDYTAWHQFVVKVDRSRGAGWEVLTKKLHGALSGGEKAIALHLPLFAAIAAHYQAVPTAPRPILLDEVFVGVDTANRGQVFALLGALDLDLVLTSDHEWCTYAELDGIAIHQLVAGTGDGDGDEAVTSVRFTWDGHVLHADGEDGEEGDDAADAADGEDAAVGEHG